MSERFSCTYALRPAGFKLAADAMKRTDPAVMDGGETIRVTSGRRDSAAFQLLVRAETPFALQLDGTNWLSQRNHIPTVRVAAEAPFPVEMHHLEMHRLKDQTWRADALLHQTAVEVDGGQVTSVYVNMTVPADAVPGEYTGRLRFWLCGGIEDEVCLGEAFFSLKVYGFTFPENRDNGFHLDLWQHPSNIARKHEVPLWSDEHFAVLEHYCRSLGELGCKCVTVVASEIPWNGQWCYQMLQDANLYEYSMIPVTRRADGSFAYDFSIMQRYIDLCAKYGIDECISVYGLVNAWFATAYREGKGPVIPDYPDQMNIRYFDEADGCWKYMREGWQADDYIRALERYFVETEQIDRVRIAADEPHVLEPFQKSLERMHANAPRFRCKSASDKLEFVEAFADLMDDFVFDIDSVSLKFDQMQACMAAHPDKRYLHYVCCGPAYPNTFLESELAESYFLCIYASFAGMHGFLRWNYAIHNDDPRTNDVTGVWKNGDNHFVYPAKDGRPLLSLRWHALARGIRFYVLLETLKKRGLSEAYDKAIWSVLREKDQSRLIFNEDKRDSFSCETADYEAMWEYMLQLLS